MLDGAELQKNNQSQRVVNYRGTQSNSEFKTLYSSEENIGENLLQGVAGIAEREKIYVKQYKEGFSALCENNSESIHSPYGNVMFDSGRTLQVANSERSRARRRYKKRTIDLWKDLFCSEKDLEFFDKDNGLVSQISKDVTAICPEQFREEYYLPFAYLKNGSLQGGNYLHLWEAGTAKAKKQRRKSINESPAKEFFTGGCMFGVPLYGVDEFGTKHSLTNPYHQISDDVKIHSIECPYDLHPDEVLTREALVNIIPLVQTLSKGEGRIRYQLPTANYILYGVNWYLKGKMTNKALTEYIYIVKARSSRQRAYLKSLSENYDIEILPYSTLDYLRMDELIETDFISHLFKSLQIDIEVNNECIKEESKSLSQELFDAIFSKMSTSPGKLGLVWGHLNKLRHEGVLKVDDPSNLLMLNYLDYSANLALSAASYGDREVFSIWPSHESPITHWYKKLFAEEFGTVMCIHWLSPLQVHFEKYRYRVFYLEKFINDVNELLSLGLLQINFLQSAAIAIDSTVFSTQLSDQLKKLFLVHAKSLKLKEERIKIISAEIKLPVYGISEDSNLEKIKQL